MDGKWAKEDYEKRQILSVICSECRNPCAMPVISGPMLGRLRVWSTWYDECAMRELWRKTANLFLNYPILWLPYACAHLLNSSLESLEHAGFMWIHLLPSMWRSALGGAPIPVHDQATATRALWVSGLIRHGFDYLEVGLGAVALVITASLVGMIVRGEQPRLRAALTELRTYPKRILGYSFKLWFLGLAFKTIVIVPALRLSRAITYAATTTGWGRVANFALTRGQLFVSGILFSWIMAPIVIRLLRGPDAEPPSAGEKKLGRYFVILTSTAAATLSAALFPLLFTLVVLPPFLERVFNSLVSLVVSFPYLMGYIALASIAAGGNWNPGETPVYRKWRQLIRSLMPLHVDGREGL